MGICLSKFSKNEEISFVFPDMSNDFSLIIAEIYDENDNLINLQNQIQLLKYQLIEY